MKNRARSIVTSFLVILGIPVGLHAQNPVPRYGYKGEPVPVAKARVVPESRPAKKAAPVKVTKTTVPTKTKPAVVAKKPDPPAAKPSKAIAQSSASKEKERDREREQERERQRKRKAASALAERQEEQKTAAKPKAKALAKSGGGSSGNKNSGIAAKQRDPETRERETASQNVKPVDPQEPAEVTPAAEEEQAPAASPSAFASAADREPKAFEPAAEGKPEGDGKKEEESAYQFVVRKVPPRPVLPPLPSGFIDRLYAGTIGAGMGVLNELPELTAASAPSRPAAIKPAPVTAPPATRITESAPVSPQWEPVTTPAAGRRKAVPEANPAPDGDAARREQAAAKNLAAAAPPPPERADLPPDSSLDEAAKLPLPSPVVFKGDSPLEISSDLMPSKPEAMPSKLPKFDAPATGKIDIHSDRQADYDQVNHKVVFTGKVEMNSSLIRLRADRLEIFMRPEGGLERLEATGQVLMRTQATANGPGQMASAGSASYNLETGEIILRDWPKIQESGKALISTDARTKMFLYTDGRMRTDGPNRTIIGR